MFLRWFLLDHWNDRIPDPSGGELVARCSERGREKGAIVGAWLGSSMQQITSELLHRKSFCCLATTSGLYTQILRGGSRCVSNVTWAAAVPTDGRGSRPTKDSANCVRSHFTQYFTFIVYHHMPSYCHKKNALCKLQQVSNQGWRVRCVLSTSFDTIARCFLTQGT